MERITRHLERSEQEEGRRMLLSTHSVHCVCSSVVPGWEGAVSRAFLQQWNLKASRICSVFMNCLS